MQMAKELSTQWIRNTASNSAERLAREKIFQIILKELNEMLQAQLLWEPVWKISYYKTSKYLQWPQREQQISGFKQ